VLFTFKVTAPANTPQTSPVKLDMKLKSGILSRIRVVIPSGHRSLAHLSILFGETQIIPWGDQEFIEGDDEVLEDEPNMALPGDPVSLEARAWNEDDTYPHSFLVRAWIRRPIEAVPADLTIEVLTRARDFFKRVLGA